jgi:hypothetical protein
MSQSRKRGEWREQTWWLKAPRGRLTKAWPVVVAKGEAVAEWLRRNSVWGYI